MTPISSVVKRNRLEPMEDEDKKLTYKSMLMEIIDVTVMNISGRFCNISRLKFLCLHYPRNFPNYQRYFPMEALNCLMETFDRCFDPVSLTSELWQCILMLNFIKMCVSCTNV